MNSEYEIRQRINLEEENRYRKMVVPPGFSIKNIRIKSFEDVYQRRQPSYISGFYYSPRGFDVLR